MIKLFGGTSNPPLVSQVANNLNLKLSRCEIIRFNNSEIKVTIEEDIKNKICIVIQPTSNPTDTNIMELLFLADALKNQKAKKIIGFIPYFGYSRQNSQYRTGECISVNVIIKLIQFIGFSQIYTIDLHDKINGNLFSIPFKNLSALPLLAKTIKKKLSLRNVTLVSPDQGGVERVREFGRAFFETKDFSFVIIDKKRSLDIPHQSKILKFHGNVKNREVIIVDDIITSGNTLVNAAKECLKQGAKKVFAVVVHHDFSLTAPHLLHKSPIEKIYSTNTILLTSKQKFNKLEEISVAPLIVEEIKYCFNTDFCFQPPS